MRDLNAALCNDRWLTTRELGALLQRDADNLQTRFLTAMVREGQLELRFPDVPNRPDQAYRRVAGDSPATTTACFGKTGIKEPSPWVLVEQRKQ